MKTIFSYVVLLALVMGSHPTRLAADDAIHVPSALLTVVERIDVPAAEEGLLTSLTVREGDLVEPGQVLGVTDTRTAALQLDQVVQDLQLAREFAKNDTRVRLARKEHELAQVELERAHKVNEGFANSVSAKEIDRLKLSVERTRLEIEFAQFEQSQNAQKMKRIEADLRLAQHQLELRKILAPIAGMIVHVEKRKGEWVNRGDLVARIVRVNRLRAGGICRCTTCHPGLGRAAGANRSAARRARANHGPRTNRVRQPGSAAGKFPSAVLGRVRQRTIAASARFNRRHHDRSAVRHRQQKCPVARTASCIALELRSMPPSPQIDLESGTPIGLRAGRSAGG